LTPEEIAAVAAEAAAQLTWKPQIPILLNGPMPRTTFCATCAVLYAYAVAKDPNQSKMVRKHHDQDVRDGLSVSVYDMPEADGAYGSLQPAVTVAPSVHSELPMPVCWTHIQPYGPMTEEQKKARRDAQLPPQPRLIPGKSHGMPT
jgi:hypothetical protein